MAQHLSVIIFVGLTIFGHVETSIIINLSKLTTPFTKKKLIEKPNLTPPVFFEKQTGSNDIISPADRLYVSYIIFPLKIFFFLPLIIIFVCDYYCRFFGPFFHTSSHRASFRVIHTYTTLEPPKRLSSVRIARTVHVSRPTKKRRIVFFFFYINVL